MATELDPVFDQAAQAFNVDPGILRGIAQTESGGNSRAVSPKGAIGLMQIMPATAAGLGVDPTDPVQSIYGAANLLRQNLDQFGNVPDALRAYNAGPNQSRWNNPETAAYVDKVAANYQPSAPVSMTPPSASPAPQQAPDAFSGLFGHVDPTASAAPATTAPQQGQDAYSSLFGHADPVTSSSSSSNGNGIFSDINQAVNAAGARIDQAGLYALNQIPGISVLKGTALDPTKLSAADKAQIASYGNSTASQIGTEAGNAMLGGLAAETGAGLAGGALGAGGALVGGTAGRVVQAGGNLLTGSGATGLAGNLLASGTSGAVKGIIAGQALGSNDPGSNALAGAALGPAAKLAGSVIAPMVRGAGNGLATLGRNTLNALAPASEDAAPAANALSAATAPQAASDATAGAAPGAASAAPPPQPDQPPPKVNLGIVPNPANGQTLADQVIAAHANGLPTVLVDSTIPGVKYTMAQGTQNAGIARLENLMRDQNPTAFQALDASNTAARNSFLQSITGQASDIDQMTADRAAAEQAGRTTAFANSQPQDATPLLGQFDQAIANNRGNDTVVNSLNKAKTSLMGALDNVQTDADGNVTAATATPESLWNVRKNIGYGISNAATDSDSLRAASSQLTPIMGSLSDTIDAGAPGFKDYAADYAQRSQAIDAARWLQTQKLTDTAGNVQPSNLNTAINAIQKARLNNSSSDASAVSDAQLQQLTALRDDLNYANSGMNLGKPRGSNTAQNLFTQGKTASLIGGKAGAVADMLASGAGFEATGSPLGALAGAATRGGQMLYQNRLAATHNAATSGILNRLLNPSTYPSASP